MSELSTQQAASAAGLSDLLEQLAKPEVQQSLTVLLEQLPQITKMLTELSGTYETLKTIATDEVFVNDLKGGFEEMVKPIQEKAKYIASAAIEAGDRSHHQSEVIGVFGVMKLLKDPQAQKMLHFIKSMLDVLNEREARR
ncbi:DUF1641 domain-containing protein [Marinicrinis lubricantis]|uniref:DUF1641 domain-containing protein n=1 Tax=Marinicrinis lubricantis TaxID=2086470 RepID=A0ABW1ITT4_9BACL